MSPNDPAAGGSTEKKEKKEHRGPGQPIAGLLLTPAAAGRELGLSPKTTREWITKKWLPSRQLGGRTVIVRAELERFIAGLPPVTSVDGALARLDAIARAAGRS